jgi:hypothetical protein
LPGVRTRRALEAMMRSAGVGVGERGAVEEALKEVAALRKEVTFGSWMLVWATGALPEEDLPA